MNNDQALSDLAEAVIAIDARVLAMDIVLTALLDHVAADRSERIRLLRNVANELVDMRKAILDHDSSVVELLTGPADASGAQDTLLKQELREQLERRIRALQETIKKS